MASLPAKPLGSPSRDVQSRYRDERGRCSRLSPHHVDDRSFSRRRVSGGDSYAPVYDTRRETNFYRRDTNDRTHSSWDRQPDLDARFDRGPFDYDRDHRDYDRDHRDYDRDHLDYDRDRREYERRGYNPNSRYRDTYRRRDQPRWRSRSPGRRDRNRSRSPYVPKRVRLGNHSVDTSPRRSSPHRPNRYSRSRSRGVSRRTRSRSSRPEPATFSNVVKTEEDVIRDPTIVTQDKGLSKTTITTYDREESYQDKSSTALPSRDVPLKKKEEEDVKMPTGQELESKVDQIYPTVKDDPLEGPTSKFIDRYPTKSHSPTSPLPTYPQLSPEKKHSFNLPSHLEGPPSEKRTREHEKLEQKLPLLPSQHRARSPSPPRQLRQRGPPGLSHPHHRSRSPPKGPRNHSSTNPRGHTTPTGPASSHAPGPRGQRRPFATPNSLSNTFPQPPTPPTQSPVTPSVSAPEDMKPTPTQVPEAVKLPLPAIPIKQLPSSLTEALDYEVARLQLQRAHLATDYTNLAKEIRRAMHELDTATIDLHAVELRRKVADAQHEKARNGLLGIDHVPAEETRF